MNFSNFQLKSVSDQLNDDAIKTASKRVEDDKPLSISEVQESSVKQDNGVAVSSKTSSRQFAASGQSVPPSGETHPVPKPDVAIQVNTSVQGDKLA
jgi:hypothetical protein